MKIFYFPLQTHRSVEGLKSDILGREDYILQFLQTITNKGSKVESVKIVPIRGF